MGARLTTLNELAARLEQLDEDLTIYVQDGPDADASSPAVAALEPEDGSLPPEAAGLDYLLEVEQACEVIEVWRRWRAGQQPSVADKVQAVLHYAKHDAYIQP